MKYKIYKNNYKLNIVDKFQFVDPNGMSYKVIIIGRFIFCPLYIEHKEGIVDYRHKGLYYFINEHEFNFHTMNVDDIKDNYIYLHADSRKVFYYCKIFDINGVKLAKDFNFSCEYEYLMHNLLVKKI